ncbi:PTS system glucose-specific transporter subunit IICBA [Paenibacillus swuensis]|uniref:PTS system glucose-specific transporter subunit IICBA n=1 Tax=Paenibacillus swuensis TaxID=1178515 RepID=A0A172TGI6_9BACL|nr:glucose-specific PTS transporter subunit IIBC [Paenibacillus swuensis]ANE46130.1 PTS system glucose-specific transporter subunit IICBA [Paenibacillus swuensis]
MFKKLFGVLQRVGKALMLPVAILPAAGILLALGSLLQNAAFIDQVPWLANEGVQLVGELLEQAGGIVFANLALLFAVGVAVGLADGEGVAGIAAIIGFLVMNVVMGVIMGVTPEMVATDFSYATVLGIHTLQTGVFGGIIVGILAAYLYRRFFRIELPSYLGFFAGKRFVPIITAASALLLGLLMTLIWPPIQSGLNYFSHSMIDANRTLAAFIFGVIERSLIPFGLHHIFYSPFWFEFGEYKNAAGQLVRGDQKIFFEQLKDGVPFTAGTFMTGKFPFMMFGLPAAALAMYHEARPEHKKMVAGIMGSAALTSFLTGITEPLEFSFLFVAPVLFGIHAIFAGLSFMTMHILNVKIGMTFSGGVIDFLLFGVLPNRSNWWLVIPVGLVFALIYYFGFRFAIRKWNLATPGREEVKDIPAGETASGNTEAGELPRNILTALGGAPNITNLDACITRLRVQVKDSGQVDKDRLKQLGASGVLQVGDNIQAIFGTRSDNLKTQIADVIAGRTPSVKAEPAKAKAAAVALEKRTEPVSPVAPVSGATPVAEPSAVEPTGAAELAEETFVSPVDGELVDISNVPDPTFADKMMGEGFAVIPSSGEVVSPVNGVIENIFPTKHAIIIRSEGGKEVLIHVGVNTVKLKGQGFDIHVADGETVTRGQKLMTVDLEFVSKNATSVITPIVFTDLDEGVKVELLKTGTVKRGEAPIIKIR